VTAADVPTETPRRAAFGRLLLNVLLLLATLRLLGFAVRFGEESLQADLAAFYTAGEALNHGLSPYENHATRQPPIWDGVDRYTHSRFLYPPLVASLFRPLALLPYRAAKHLWMGLSLAAVAVSLVITARALGLGRGSLLGAALWACLYHPLLALLERGQIDAVTLLLVSLAFARFVKAGDGVGPGALLALATLLKLNVAFFVPFLIAARKWKALAGYAAGALVLVIASAMVNGPAALVSYARDELPRIAAHGEGGPSDRLLDPALLQALRPGLAESKTVKDGSVYDRETFGFVANASLARVIASWTGQRGESPMTGRAAVGVGLGLFLVLLATGRGARPWDTARTATFWQAVMVAVLICGPLTWVMNLVWLLPVGLLLWHQADRASSPASLAAMAVGLLLASLPDRHVFPLLAPYRGSLLDYQYVLAEVLVAGGLVGLLSKQADLRG